MIRFELPTASEVAINIYNIRGQLVRRLANETLPAGVHAIQWDALDDSGVRVSSGLYIYQLRAGSFTATKRMTLMK
jgi:flagellar hook assembly protein FlgD